MRETSCTGLVPNHTGGASLINKWDQRRLSRVLKDIVSTAPYVLAAYVSNDDGSQYVAERSVEDVEFFGSYDRLSIIPLIREIKSGAGRSR